MGALDERRDRSFSPERKVILERAVSAFTDHGYEGASIQILVKRLGMHRAGVYSIWKSKAELFLAAFRAHCEGRLAEIEASLAEGPPLERLRSLGMEVVGKGLTGREKVCLVARTALGSGSLVPGVAEVIRSYFDRVQGLFAQAIRRAQESGALDRKLDADRAAALFLLGLGGLCISSTCGQPEGQRRGDYATLQKAALGV